MAIKKSSISMSVVGGELKKLLEAVEQEEKAVVALGETDGPLLDLYETSEHIVVEADLPGMDPANIEVSIQHGLLTIEGVKSEKIEEAGRINYLCMERSFEPFRRVVKIGAPINPKGAKAAYSLGVLTVSFPKVPEKRGEPIKIPIERPGI